MFHRLTAALLVVLTPAPAPETREYIAFRVDDERVIAVLKTHDEGARQMQGNEVSGKPAAAYGFTGFEPPPEWLKYVPPEMRPGARWKLDVGGGRMLDALAERVVGGQAQCSEAVAMMMRIAPEHAADFAAARARYFIAREAAKSEPLTTSADNRIGFLPQSAVTPEMRGALETALDELMRREHPKIVKEAADDVRRMQTNRFKSHRILVERWRRQDDALVRGETRLAYDIQGVQLTREGPPVFFVRAEWFLGDFQAFAAAVWVRFGEKLEIVQTDVRPASWLRMAIFQGKIYPLQMGMILNVLDRDGDGFGEILFAQGGYESVAISLLEYSASGFEAQGIEFNQGC
jgi:hypothetical protein